jgi:inorganic pyrophosphatase
MKMPIVAALTDLDPGKDFPRLARLIVEIPKHSANKYEFDKNLGVFRLDRPLYSPLHYPGDYGFIPGTLAEDGDCLDVLALIGAGTFPGCLYDIRPVGLLNMMDQGTLDQKVLAVPAQDPRFDNIRSIDDVFPHIRKEIEHFFTIYKHLEGKKTEVRGWKDREQARKLMLAARKRYLKLRKSKEGF